MGTSFGKHLDSPIHRDRIRVDAGERPYGAGVTSTVDVVVEVDVIGSGVPVADGTSLVVVVSVVVVVVSFF
jgi:hypothetical protein